MSKGLKALKELKKYNCSGIVCGQNCESCYFNVRKTLIEKELEGLEIIRGILKQVKPLVEIRFQDNEKPIYILLVGDKYSPGVVISEYQLKVLEEILENE